MRAAFDALKGMDNQALVRELEGVMKGKMDAWDNLIKS